MTNIITVTGDAANQMHDALNLFSGLYDVNSSGSIVYRSPMANDIVADVASLLSVSTDSATALLMGQADSSITSSDSGDVFTYDADLLPNT
jgi:hypothetical protein